MDDDMLARLAAAGLTVLLWRGHWKVDFGCFSIYLPLHSMVAFTWGIIVTQNYDRIVSFLLFGVAWFFLATNEHRRKHPSPWHQCKPYGGLLVDLLFGFFCGCIGFCINSKGTRIEANQNFPSIERYNVALKKRQERLAKQREQAALDASEMDEEDLKNALDIESQGEDAVEVATSQKSTILQKMNPLKPILHPVQKILHEACRILRVAKSIVLWEENYYSFWITSVSLAGSLLVFSIPWGFIISWVIRIMVWVVLGPWMKLVDWLYFEKFEHMTGEERRDALQQELRTEYKQRMEYYLFTQKMKEKAMKVKSMLKYLFGKVRMLMTVPCLVGAATFAIGSYNGCSTSFGFPDFEKRKASRIFIENYFFASLSLPLKLRGSCTNIYSKKNLSHTTVDIFRTDVDDKVKWNFFWGKMPWKCICKV